MEENKIQPLSEYIQLKIEAAYQKAVSQTSILYRNEYIDQLAMEIFMDMIHNDVKLQHHMQTVINEWYNGVIQNISLNDLREKTTAGIYFANIGVGTFSTYLVYSGGYYKWNEVWHKTKTAGTAFRWESRWKKNFSVQNRAKDISRVTKYRKIAGKVTKGSGILLVADIAVSGEIKPSHVINGAMLGASTTGVGSIVAAIWFAADLGTTGINILISGEAKGLGDIIDEGLSGYCIKIY
ncbi:hypothetical protein [Bacteroides pyogenes]|uniref:hypothetical protein n=1 Tax=Bacteroides pyogenes TaxID=310300 RepID=UPI002FDACCDA